MSDKTEAKSDAKSNSKEEEIPDPKPKKAKKAPKKKGWGSVFKENALQMYRGLFSKDRRTRRYSALFFVCFVGLIWMIVYGPFATNEKLKELEARKAAQLEAEESIKPLDAARALNLLEEEEKERKKNLSNVLYLGKFITELEGQEKISSSSGVLNIAEIHISIQCDSKLTCDYIERRKGKIKDSITGLIRPLSRAKLLSPEGKEELKERIMKGLNHWLPTKNSVENIFFTKLIIG